MDPTTITTSQIFFLSEQAKMLLLAFYMWWNKAAAVLSEAADLYLLGGIRSRCFCVFAPVSWALIETSVHSRSPCAHLLWSAAWVELIDLWKRGCMCLLLFQRISGCVTWDVSWSLLKKVPITSGLIPHHFALARRQSDEDTEMT